MSRRWLIGVSLVAHVGLGIGLFVTGVWRIERLDPGRQAALSIGVMMPPPPPPPPAGGAAPAAVTPTPMPNKRVVRDTQPAPSPPEAPPIAATTANPAPGTGTGEGPGVADGELDGVPGGVTCEIEPGCAGPRTGTVTCGNRLRESHETCDDGNTNGGDGCSAICQTEPAKPTMVAPAVLVALRISGSTQVHPPDPTKTAMLRAGHHRSIGVLKTCVGTAGQVASVAIASSTRYADYDARLVAAVRTWRYRPHTLDGRPVPVCGTVTFVYSIK